MKVARIGIGAACVLLGGQVLSEWRAPSISYAQSGGIPRLPERSAVEGSLSESRPSSNTPAQSPVGSGRRYLLGAGDVLRMEIFNLPDYSRNYQISSDGYLALPLIRPVFVGGLTLEQLQLTVSNLYREYIQQPIVTFEIIEARPLQIAVVGEVNRPGTYTVAMSEQEDANGMTPPTLTRAIQLANGITQSADVRQIEIYRQDPYSPATPTVQVVSLWDLLTQGDINADVVLQDGDSIRIPTALDLDAAEASTLASASFSPDEMTVYVVGEVDSPGQVRVSPNTPLNQALLAAGGFNERARTASVELVRLNENGTVEQRDIQVDLAADVSPENNPMLQEADTIVVRRSGASAFADAASNFVSPFNLLINLFRAIGGN